MFYTFAVFVFLFFFLFFYKKMQHMLISTQFPSRTTNCWSVVIQDIKDMTETQAKPKKYESHVSCLPGQHLRRVLCTQLIYTHAS